MGRSDSVSLWSLMKKEVETGGGVAVEELVSRYLDAHGGCGFFYMGEGENRVKKEAEQAACKSALDAWGRFSV
jgi:dsRNA-specific ribonuclease